MAVENEEKSAIDFGEFRVGSVNDKHAEGRLTDEKHGSTFVSRFAKANKQLERGATIRLIGEVVADAPAPAAVTVEVAPEDLGSMPGSAKVVKEKDPAGGSVSE